MMKTIHKESADAAAEYGLGYDLVAGANTVSYTHLDVYKRQRYRQP